MAASQPTEADIRLGMGSYIEIVQLLKAIFCRRISPSGSGGEVAACFEPHTVAYASAYFKILTIPKGSRLTVLTSSGRYDGFVSCFVQVEVGFQSSEPEHARDSMVFLWRR